MKILYCNYKNFCPPRHATRRHGKGFPSVIITRGRILTDIHLIYQVKKVHMIAVGVGRGIKDSELKKLAGDKGHYVHPVDFNHLSYILGKLKDAACGTVLIFLFILSCNIHQPINTLNILKSP